MERTDKKAERADKKIEKATKKIEGELRKAGKNVGETEECEER